MYAFWFVDWQSSCNFLRRTGFSQEGDRLDNRTIRVLLAEDFEPYRTLVASLLAAKTGFQVIGVASDGLEAMEKVERFRPDLVVMDIGLPKLNGLSAARRICELQPTPKIVFLTQETDADVVKEALKLGAVAYLTKQRVGSDLGPALEAILDGKRFVSGGLDGGESVPRNGKDRAD
jgi:DNA-binding NarL/FixJ family response regulator